MSKRILHILAAILSVCMALGALDLTGFISFVPPDLAKTLVTLPPIFLAIGHCVLSLGDQLDDGQKNDSFPGSLQLHPGTLLGAFLIPAATSFFSPKLAAISLGLLAIVWFLPSVIRSYWGKVSLACLICCLALPSCAPDRPFNLSVFSPETGLTGSYSSKSGLSVSVTPPRAVVAPEK